MHLGEVFRENLDFQYYLQIQQNKKKPLSLKHSSLNSSVEC